MSPPYSNQHMRRSARGRFDSRFVEDSSFVGYSLGLSGKNQPRAIRLNSHHSESIQKLVILFDIYAVNKSANDGALLILSDSPKQPKE